MSKPLVSVKMITYNHAPYIRRAVEGVLQQKTNFPFELVIGEDCSTDGTREIVFEYERRYPDLVRVIYSKHNVGASANNRQTAKACSGKYLAFCEGDDFWHDPGKLQKQVGYLESHPECGLVYSGYDVYHPSSNKTIRDFIQFKRWKMPENPTLEDFVEEQSVLGRGIATCSVVLRRCLYDEVKAADPYLHQGDHFRMGDTQLWAEMSLKARVHFIPESLATHVISEESATRSKDVTKLLLFGMSQAEMMLYLCSKHNLPQHLREPHERWWCNASLRLALHRRDLELANEVRMKRKKFSVHEWFRYFGAKYAMVHYGYVLTSRLLEKLKQKHDHWS
jgi:glycosyltransferase involved in cell wall biosynthesis